MDSLWVSINLVVFVAVSPLVSGGITKIKNLIRMRRGPGVFQPYYALSKLLIKQEVVSATASWLYRVAPAAVFSSSLAGVFLLPFLAVKGFYLWGDFLALVFVLGLGRFFLVLAGLDTASAFGGMGSSREMFISSLAEPVVCLVVLTFSLHYGSTNLGAVASGQGWSLSCITAAVALFLVALAETSRIPIDNQETHLELTMIHEAMVLEYSGPALALLEWAASIKQLIWFSLLIAFAWPMALQPGGAGGAVWWLVFLAKVALLALVVSVVEVSCAKMRLFRVADYFSFATVIALIAVVMALVGG